MEPANQPPLRGRKRSEGEATETDFLPDADAIERMPLPRYLRLTLHVLAGALLAFIVWASVSQVDVIVSAPGRLVNRTPNIVVQPLETSIVQRVTVRPGQVVRKGEVLAMLDPTFTQADEAQLRNRMRSLETQAQGLQGELTGKPGASTGQGSADEMLQAQIASERRANFTAQRAKMSENIARLRASVDTNKRDQQVLAERLKSLSQIEAMQERLVAENFGAKLQLLEARDRRLEVERTLVMSRNKDIEMARELAATEAEMAAFDKSWRQKAMEDLLSATRERDSLAEQLAKADKRHQLVTLTAPADGVVLEVSKMSTGSVIREAEQMFVLVPLGAKMEAEVQVESQDVGTLKLGAPVHVKLDAFPFQKHGMLDGKVRNISEDAFRREQVAQGQGDAYYVGRIELGPVRMRNMAQARLLPGMTLNAEIVVGRRSVMSYLLWPLTKALDEAIREP
ncbi:HlyD family secretion protein [Pseudoduganella lurida]|uniref:Membrane fusion protein (MFP) family protein n=1 Tax=Pseudoduganella lurida TaxID=1036180 RepID=A0A562QWF1_9BURK|nr:HlyD family type I secretion periplasmic adaptor subunit [Pseudoduganella lurida]TWI60654.1 HlyD family secretion protein [Pseudoduganella lurida]